MSGLHGRCADCDETFTSSMTISCPCPFTWCTHSLTQPLNTRRCSDVKPHKISTAWTHGFGDWINIFVWNAYLYGRPRGKLASFNFSSHLSLPFPFFKYILAGDTNVFARILSSAFSLHWFRGWFPPPPSVSFVTQGTVLPSYTTSLSCLLFGQTLDPDQIKNKR